MNQHFNGYKRIAAAIGMTACLAITMNAQDPTGEPLEIVARVPWPDFSGVVRTHDGRIFLGFPRHADDHDGPTLAEYIDGKLAPYPTAAMSLPGEIDPAKRLVSVHGMTLDSRGRLWMIDDGKEAGKPIQPGAVKIVGIDVATGKLVAKIILPEGVYLPKSHMNDLRVDTTHGQAGTVFVTDSSFDNEPALVVVDIATGKSRRIFEHSRFTAADQDFMTYLEGVPHVYSEMHPTFPQGGADGIELSSDSTRLYWTSLTGRRLYSAPTEILSNMNSTPNQLDTAVRDEGERPNSDGLARDSQGRIYFGAFDQQSIVRRNVDGSFQLIAHDERLRWPDGLFISDGYLYVTLGQWNRMASLNGGKEVRKPPYLLVRMQLPE